MEKEPGMQITKPISPTSTLGKWVYTQRKRQKLTRNVLAAETGVGARFIRELEQGKATVRLDKVCQVLSFFGHELGVIPLRPEQSYETRINRFDL